MRELYFNVTLKQDVVLSAQSATEGQHQCLDFIPGSVFLGVAASRGYAKLTPEDAWTVFHSGKVRFTDALPCEQGQIAFPLPLSFHTYKGDRATTSPDSNLFDATKLFDPAMIADEVSLQQPKQLRNGYVTESGLRLQPALSYRMKTAIDSSEGRAAKGQLYGYQALEAGQTFLFSVQADQGCEGLLEQVSTLLSGTAQLGRSRSAQYGGVEITLADEAIMPVRQSGSDSHKLTLWLKSDLALVDASGYPTLLPTPLSLGLPDDSRWLPEQSYIRSRRYSPYNAKRRSYDPERPVICRGSVLRFELSSPLDTLALSQLRNMGLHQAAGLGQVYVNPTMLSEGRPSFEHTKDLKVKISGPTRLASPGTALIALLQQRSNLHSEQNDTSRIAEAIFQELCVFIEEARNWNGASPGSPLDTAPKRTQWGGIKSLANNLRQQPDQLWQQLFDAPDALIRQRSGWELQAGLSQTLASRIRDLFEDHHLGPKTTLLPEVVGRIAVLGLSNRWLEAVDGKSPMQRMEADA